MTRAGNTTYAYDDNGNMTSKSTGSSTTDYAYDFEDRMVSAGTTDYAYDPFGRKVSSGTVSTETDYLFDGYQVVQEGTGSASVRYSRGLGETLISRRQGEEGSPTYYGHDAVGSTTSLISSGGTLTDSYAYTAFGQIRGRTGTSTQPFTYLGNALDKSTGLYDFHARQYDYSTGRFTSEDPVKGLAYLPQTLNPYSCSVNNPLAHPDPSGMFPLMMSEGGVGGSRAGELLHKRPRCGKVARHEWRRRWRLPAAGRYRGRIRGLQRLGGQPNIPRPNRWYSDLQLRSVSLLRWRGRYPGR